MDKILYKSLKKNGLAKQVATADFMGQLQDAGELIFGQEVMKKLKFMSCQEGILTIACLSSVLAQDLKNREKEIIGKLNGFYGRRVVERLKLIA